MKIDHETWSTHEKPVIDELISIRQRLETILGVSPGGADMLIPPTVHNYDEAVEVILIARRRLLLNLLLLETHEHWLDDCGDDVAATTELWEMMRQTYFYTDGDPVGTTQAVNEALASFRKDYGFDEGEVI